MYKIVFGKSLIKDFKSIPKLFLSKIESAIGKLAEVPIPKQAKRLQGYKNHYRLRLGMYRIIYHIDKKIEIISILKVDHRKEVYRSF